MTLERKKMLPFLLTLSAIAADQAVKFFIVKNWPKNGTFIKDVFGNELLEIYHVRNKAIAFSLGYNLPEILRPFLFVVVPVGVLVFLVVYYFKSNEFTPLQRWSIAGILGGGTGNLIDRIFRPDGVVDFVSVNMPWDETGALYGLLGFSRWPTFNLADSFVVVFGILLLCSIFITKPGSDRAGRPG